MTDSIEYTVFATLTSTSFTRNEYTKKLIFEGIKMLLETLFALHLLKKIVFFLNMPSKPPYLMYFRSYSLFKMAFSIFASFRPTKFFLLNPVGKWRHLVLVLGR